LILVAKDDRKMTIRTGYGMEHILTDALSRRIIETHMVPHFRESDYYGGLDESTTAIIQIFAGEYDAEPTEDVGIIGVIFACRCTISSLIDKCGSTIPENILQAILAIIILFLYLANKYYGSYKKFIHILAVPFI